MSPTDRGALLPGSRDQNTEEFVERAEINIEEESPVFENPEVTVLKGIVKRL